MYPGNISIDNDIEHVNLQLKKPSNIRLGNWEALPLSEQQLEYAATDAYASWYLYQVNTNRLLMYCYNSMPLNVVFYIAIPSSLNGWYLFYHKAEEINHFILMQVISELPDPQLAAIEDTVVEDTKQQWNKLFDYYYISYIFSINL